jgi:hypothetical protein
MPVMAGESEPGYPAADTTFLTTRFSIVINAPLRFRVGWPRDCGFVGPIVRRR